MSKRKKYSYQFRLDCVEMVLGGKGSVHSVAKEQGVDRANLRLWLGFYEKYGKQGLESKASQRYNEQFKLTVLNAIDNELLSLRAACFRFNIPSESVIISWKRAYELKGAAGLISKIKGRPPKMKPPKNEKSNKPLTREEELLKENTYLKAENELLKKLQALAHSGKKQKP